METFPEYCRECGSILQVEKCSRFGYVTKWCSGLCAKTEE